MKPLDYFLPLYNALVAIDPSLPRALFVALVFATVLAWRKFWPTGWAKFSNLIPVTDEDTSWFKATLQKLWQALPAAVLGAIYGALGTGGDVWATVKLSLMALTAPVIHEVAMRYTGRLGTPDGKLPPPGEKPAKPLPPWGDVTPASLPGAKDETPPPPSIGLRFAWVIKPLGTRAQWF